MLFTEFLIKNNIDPVQYMIIAKKNAKNYILNPDNLHFSDKPKYKLYYENNGDKIYFGGNMYFDFIIYNILERRKKFAKGFANKRKELYRTRAMKIQGDWVDKLSKNNLAIHILW